MASLPPDRSAVFLFPGQGSQAPGMGMPVADADPEAAALLERAESLTGLPLVRLIRRGPMKELTLTNVLQPAICAVSAVMLLAVRKRGIEAAVCAGHSLGELTAFFAAGAFDFDALIRLAAERGRLMQEAADRCGGGMVAVSSGAGAVADAAFRLVAEAEGDGRIVVANLNSPRQAVLSGDEAALASAVEKAPALGLVARPLAVSGPWHSPAMTEAAEAFSAVLEKEGVGDCRIPVWSAINAASVMAASDVVARLAGAIDAPLRWADTVHGLWRECAEIPWVEVGPGKVLTGLVLETEPGAALYRVDTPRALDRLVRAYFPQEDREPR